MLRHFFFKLQVSLGKTIETSGKSTGKCKKSKISPTTIEKPTTLTSDATEIAKDTTLPNFNNVQQTKNVNDIKNFPPKSTNSNLSRSNSNESDIYDINQIANEAELKPNLAGKLPLPRLPNLKLKQHNLAPPKSLTTVKSKIRSQKYKNIQPKLQKCDNFSSQERNQTQVETSDILLGDDQLKDIEIITRERLISVSNVDKDALDDYLHGGNNSQEQEEELLQYFKNNNGNNESLNDNIGQSTTVIGDDELSNGSKSDKLSQLRLLLEQNLNQSHQAQLTNQQDNHINNTFVKAEKNTYTLPTSTTVLSSKHPFLFSFFFVLSV